MLVHMMKGLGISLLAVTALSVFSQGETPMPFDVAWWQHVNSDEQQGFVYGYLDCRQLPKAAKASIVDYQNAVSASMTDHATSDPRAVSKAVERAATTIKSRDTHGAENYSGRHGFLDGGWWGDQPANWGDSDRGYLEGYLECKSAPVTAEMVRRLQSEINHHYASGRHEHDKIADVLRSLLTSTPKDRQAN